MRLALARHSIQAAEEGERVVGLGTVLWLVVARERAGNGGRLIS